MDTKNTGRFICQLRKENGLTQAALAEKLNISNRTVSKWENGDGFPDITILPGLSAALGVSVDELLDGKKREVIADLKVTEVESRANLDNIFLITYIISLFGGVFAALLGGLTELYCIFVFPVLFYTHWEIIFVAAALAVTIVSGLVFSVGTARLAVSYNKEEIAQKAGRKAFLLSLILGLFPLTFIIRVVTWLIRIFNIGMLYSLPTDLLSEIATALIVAAFAVVFSVVYKRYIK